MINWSLITGFDWDEGNARKSVDKHSVSQAEAEQMFFNEPLLMLPDHMHSQTERRIHALGRTDDNRLLFATFTLRDADSRIRVISVRDMNRKERSHYDQQNEANPNLRNRS
jgi:uncharacterized protein